MNLKLDENLYNSIINYKNEDVIERFIDKYNIDENEALSIFEETKKWLWLCHMGAIGEKKFSFIIDDSLLIIDEMWHNFILFTKEYNDFCINNFGYYMHHQPTTKQDKNDWQKDPVKGLKEYKKKLQGQYEKVYDLLGESTLNKWYVYFADKYTSAYIYSIIK